MYIQREPVTDWPAVIAALCDLGHSLRSIGDALDIAHTTVQRWHEGSTPNYEDGKALLELLAVTRKLG